MFFALVMACSTTTLSIGGDCAIVAPPAPYESVEACEASFNDSPSGRVVYDEMVQRGVLNDYVFTCIPNLAERAIH